LLACILASCITAKQLGREGTEAAVDVIKEEMPGMVGASGHAIRDSILNQATGEKLDSIMVDLMVEMTIRAETLRDSLLGTDMDRLLANKLGMFGDSAQVYASRIREALMGPAALEFLALARNELLGDSTLAGVAAIRDEMLGPGSHKYFKAIMDTSFAAVWEQYKRVVKPEIREQLGFIQNYASILLTAAGAVGLIIIGFLYRQKRKLARILSMLAFQIHKMPDRPAYDELTRRVRMNAQEHGLEPALRRMLGKQGILGRDSWVPTGTDGP